MAKIFLSPGALGTGTQGWNDPLLLYFYTCSACIVYTHWLVSLVYIKPVVRRKHGKIAKCRMHLLIMKCEVVYCACLSFIPVLIYVF